MRTIDIHAHLMPQCFWNAVSSGGDWYGMTYEPEPGNGVTVSNGKRDGVTNPLLRSAPQERIEDMDRQGVDVQLVSIATPMFGYHLPANEGLRLAQDVNAEIASMVRQWPERFAGLATLPMQDVAAAVGELERAVSAWVQRGRTGHGGQRQDLG